MQTKRIFTFTVVFLLILSSFSIANPFLTKPLSKERIRLLPVPKDYRNYFFFQSFGNDSYIIIGDFTGGEKVICHIYDKGNDNIPDRIIEYYPDQKKYRIKSKPSTKFFTNLKQMKIDIISGAIFKRTYSYKMKSLDMLKYKLKEGSDLFTYGHGQSVKYFDPDATTTIMSEFFYSNRRGKYDLIFKTNYYKLYKMRIKPPVQYSVYCKESSDPIVKETVEKLLKLTKK